MEPFKNLLGPKAARRIARAVKRAHSPFSEAKFLKNIEQELFLLEFKDRMLFLEHRLSMQLTRSPESFPLLVQSLSRGKGDDIGLSSFQVWPLTHFVARHGINDFPASMTALKEMTKVFTAEFAVRPFFLKDEARMLKIFTKWTRDSNEHVRRLASEGSRPSLPWGQKLPRFLEDPRLTWPLLEALKNDESKYVQKSVANHMNDLSKVHGNWLTKKLKDWPNPWVVRHGLRTLVKQGHPQALFLIGVDIKLPKIHGPKLLTKRLCLGDSLEHILTLHNTQKKRVKIVVDVEVYFLKANGGLSPKVFKGKTLELDSGAKQEIRIKTPLRVVTTRKYYPGMQKVILIVNGSRLKATNFIIEG